MAAVMLAEERQVTAAGQLSEEGQLTELRGSYTGKMRVLAS